MQQRRGGDGILLQQLAVSRIYVHIGAVLLYQKMSESRRAYP
jgi:hypothetical protein